MAVLVIVAAPLLGLSLGAAIVLAATSLLAFLVLWLLGAAAGSI